MKNKFLLNNNLANKYLVVNLSSALTLALENKFTQIELNIRKLSYFVKSVITGRLLSDDSIIFDYVRSKNAYLNLTQSMAHSGYMYSIFWRATILVTLLL